MCAGLENGKFSGRKSLNYLAVSNNLLLSLLSLSGAPPLNSYSNTLMYAREASRATPTGKGIPKNSSS